MREESGSFFYGLSTRFRAEVAIFQARHHSAISLTCPCRKTERESDDLEEAYAPSCCG